MRLEWSFLILSLVMLNMIHKTAGSELSLQQCNWSRCWAGAPGRQWAQSNVSFLWSVAQIWRVTALDSSRTMILCRCLIPSNCVSVVYSLQPVLILIFKWVNLCRDILSCESCSSVSKWSVSSFSSSIHCNCKWHDQRAVKCRKDSKKNVYSYCFYLLSCLLL